MTLRRSFVQLVLVRFREFIREPEAVFWTFIFPILLAAGLGIAFQQRGPEATKVAVVADGPEAERVIAALRADTSLAVSVLDDTAAARALRTGEVALLARPRGADGVEYAYDDARPDARNARLTVDRALQSAAGRRDPIVVEERTVRERGSRYIDFVVPGILGMNLMGSGIWSLGFAIVDARKRKLLKRLVATPMSRAEYLLSFLASRLVFLIVEVGVLIGFGALVFDVPLRGSGLALAAICLLGALAFGGLGLLISSRARTIEGASGLMNLVMLPMWIFSGVFFSAKNFPDTLQPFIQALPLTAVNDALRANMLQGAGWRALAPELGIIVAWMTLCFILALKLFRWR